MDSNITELVQERYGAAAERAAQGQKTGCCGGSCGPTPEAAWDPITANLYDEQEQAGVPAGAMLASFGCGNPTALASLRPGETVLDLGSGGGIDVFLSTKRVGVHGKVYGLDMTDQMLDLARENQRKAGVTNVEFLKGEIEHIPLPDNSVDVIISNCVINLSADKDQVLREAFRVLKPGGHFAVADIVIRGEIPEAVRRNMELWAGCVAGALKDSQYVAKLARAGFDDIDLEPARVYSAADVRTFLAESGLDADAISRQVDGQIQSAFIRAVKPVAPSITTASPQGKKECCGPSCCQ